MTELTQVGLITQIEQLVVPYRQLALWSLGQSGFGIKGGATIAYIRPYLLYICREANRLTIHSWRD